jgi:hypothetical protein
MGAKGKVFNTLLIVSILVQNKKYGKNNHSKAQYINMLQLHLARTAALRANYQFLSLDATRNYQKAPRQTILLLRVFTATGTCSPSCCLVMVVSCGCTIPTFTRLVTLNSKLVGDKKDTQTAR